jgi:hypothetical protein
MTTRGSSAREKQPAKKELPWKKGATAEDDIDMLPEYDFSKMSGVRGKYFHQAWAGHGVRRLSPDIAKAFPDDESVNNALRLLVDLAQRQKRPTKRSKA